MAQKSTSDIRIHQIINYVATNIGNGEWKVGEAIPSENELCARLHVSRVSVRNALQRFIALGILESHQGKGTFLMTDDVTAFLPHRMEETAVRTESLDGIRQLLDFRLMTEPSICAAAAKCATPALIEELEQLYRVMTESVGDAQRFVETDLRFHEALVRSKNNPLLTNIMESAFASSTTMLLHLNSVVGYHGGLFYHALILDAVREQDEKKAFSVMESHLRHTLEEL